MVPVTQEVIVHDIIIAPTYWALLEHARQQIPPTVRELRARTSQRRRSADHITQLEASTRIGRQWRHQAAARSCKTIAIVLTALHGYRWTVVAGPDWVAAGPSVAIRAALAAAHAVEVEVEP